MDNIVPHREIGKLITVRQSDFRGVSMPASLGFHVAPYPLSQKTGSAIRQHAVVIGITAESLHAVCDQMRQGRAGLEQVLFEAGLDEARWQAELQARLEEVYARSWRASEVSIFVVRDGFTTEQFNAVLAGLQYIPRAVYLVSAQSAKGAAAVHAVQRPKSDRLQTLSKRALDFVGGLGLLLFLAPLMLVIGLVIKLDSSGPVFFRQRRLGFLGKPFEIYKFRTMTVQENGDTVIQARPQDPRVTRIGRFLRRSSLDELPQLLNVMKGEMSLVGPRPHAEAHDRHYSAIVPRYTFRRYVKPGMTGWAQVHGYRGQITSLDDITQRVEFDSWYAKNGTVFLDIKILFRTIAIVLNQKNAF
jgi:exopolysaccharide biosynthesis polyprenyl glycosylphosphotransferase